VKEMFGAVGLSEGVYTPPPGLNLTLVNLII
jgi:hypothetical protein